MMKGKLKDIVWIVTLNNYVVWCYVDFICSIIPPGEPAILDEEGVQVKGLIGPYNEGDALLLVCESIGGNFIFI
ncbi:hypothetical protein CDAR_560521 [Caerostris darwini]|uniref:Uncharacterized protein n=1 Tax=Caerostris darwini TaxID=1538125 RepID=A0AAV4VYY2_9ARAC|nr:hypothetical protein CDAR_560261 [Caerostris darwini]GIY75697.1 hypothetical protein CDAR_560521 [Caerostris darwini]